MKLWWWAQRAWYRPPAPVAAIVREFGGARIPMKLVYRGYRDGTHFWDYPVSVPLGPRIGGARMAISLARPNDAISWRGHWVDQW